MIGSSHQIVPSGVPGLRVGASGWLCCCLRWLGMSSQTVHGPCSLLVICSGSLWIVARLTGNGPICSKAVETYSLCLLNDSLKFACCAEGRIF